MKYIRTKDNILIAPELYDGGEVVLYSDPPMYEVKDAKGETHYIDCDKVLKKADTIEELCDEIILKTWSNEYQRIEYHRLVSVEEYLLLYNIHHDDELYGAIWTEKGLIYVAKMNEKGDFELL